MSIYQFLKEGDKILNCEKCHNDFIYAKKQQERDKQRGFPKPRRCSKCTWLRERGIK